MLGKSVSCKESKRLFRRGRYISENATDQLLVSAGFSKVANGLPGKLVSQLFSPIKTGVR